MLAPLQSLAAAPWGCWEANPSKILSEDKAIVFETARLSTIWTDELNDNDRADWLARWTTRPPVDIYGHQYVTTTPTALNQVQRPASRVYAWSQIFGTFRLATLYVKSPTYTTDAPISISTAAASTSSLTVTVTSNGQLPAGWPVLIYATEALRPTIRAPIWRLRFIEAFTGANDGDILDVSARYFARWNGCAGGRVGLRAATVNANNELVPGSQYPEAPVAA